MSNDVDRPLKGEVALVTGAGRGIGRAIALELAARGAHVIGCARTESELQETVALVERAGGAISSSVLDVTDRRAVGQMVTSARTSVGPISILVNNAGVSIGLGPFRSVDPEAWWRDIEVNLGGTVNCSHAVLDGMLEAGRGHIVNIVSSMAFRAVPLFGSYATSKAAVHAFTANLASETTAHGVCVFSLMPGFVHTALVDRAIDLGIEQLSAQLNHLLEVGANAPERAAVLTAQLCSGAADMLSGRFFDAAEDLNEVLARQEEILEANLYTVQTPRRRP